MALILVSRASRSLAYGALAVVFAQGLASRGLSALVIGALISAALLAGAIASAATGRLMRALGARMTYAGSGMVMVAAAVSLRGDPPSIVVGCLLGVVSPGGQDVGPFAAIEQVVLMADEAAVVRSLSWYNLIGAISLAVGALVAVVLPFSGILVLYGAAGIVVACIPKATFVSTQPPRRRTRFRLPARPPSPAP
jgi:hypothetical protein